MITDISADRDSIYVTCTPNLRLLITISDQEREQGRLRGSIEGAGGTLKRTKGGARNTSFKIH
jgi:hypothetical protein